MNTTVAISKTSSQSIYSDKVTSSISLFQSATFIKSTNMAQVDNSNTFENKLCPENSAKYLFSDFSQISNVQKPRIIDEFIENDDITTLDLLLSYTAINDDIAFQNNGYKKMGKICDTLQGALYKAIKIDKTLNKNTEYVAIKKTDKVLFQQQIAIEHGFNFCVSENIIKESIILKYLTVDNQPIGDYIIKYIDFFQSDTDYYLVMEYISSEMNLKQFITVCHEYIENDQLSQNQYDKIIKFVLWQLFVTIQWLHIKMKCCHLDICTENIMLSNVHFVKTKYGMTIGSNISIKLSDFGVSEVFNSDSFLCEKYGLSLQNETYSAPNVFNGDIYDAQCADNWLLGMILFECITGNHLYEAMDINTNSIQSGYWALHHKKLKKYLRINNLLRYFNVNSFDLLKGLLNVVEYQRLKGMHILQHKWFKMYYQKYNHQISKKFKQ